MKLTSSFEERMRKVTLSMYVYLAKHQIESPQESTRLCPGCKVERDFVDNVNGLTTQCKTCRGTWDAFDGMFAK